EMKADVEAIARPASTVVGDPVPASRKGPSYVRWVLLPTVVLFILLVVGTCIGMATGHSAERTDHPTPGFLLGYNGILLLSLTFVVVSLVWVLRPRDEETPLPLPAARRRPLLVPLCGVLDVVAALVSLCAASYELLLNETGGGPVAETGPGRATY